MFETIKKTLGDFFNSLSKTKKIVLISGVVVAVLLLTFLILFFTKTEYVVLANGLDASSAKEVTATLDSLGIEWKDEANLSVIKVPKRDLAKAKMELSVSFSAGTISWQDLMTADNFTMTTGTREHMFVQAKANEVKESIETISSVKEARVMLYIPKDSNYFITDRNDAKASIILQLSGELERDRIQGIVNLVCTSVKGLEPINVTILDQTGKQLNDHDMDGADFTANSAFELKYNIEASIKKDMEDFLGVIYGVDNVNVQPSVKLDFDKQSETVTKYSPPIEGESNGLVRSLTTISENVSHDTSSGAPGTDSNPTAVTEGDDDNGVYKKASETLNYELNEVVRLLEKAEGGIEDITIAVVINTKALEDETMTPEHQAELTKLVSNAVGTPPEKVVVSTQAFADPLVQYDEYIDGNGTQNAQMFMIIAAVATGALIIVIIAIILLAKKKKKQAEEEQRQQEELEKIEEKTDDLFNDFGESEDKGSPKYQIERFIDKNPEAAVVLLRTWING